MVHVVLPGLLADAFRAPRRIDVPAGRLGEVLAHLDRLHPGLAARLAGADGRIRPYVHLFVDGEHVRDAGPDLVLPPGAEIRFVASIAGG